MGSEEPPRSVPHGERRRHPRHERWFPVTVDVAGREVWSICRDVSETGMLVASRQPVPPGTPIVLRFKLGAADSDDQVVEAKVVRCERNEDDLGLAFPARLGIHFDRPIEALERGLRETPARR
jgi:hypothetical protein